MRRLGSIVVLLSTFASALVASPAAAQRVEVSMSTNQTHVSVGDTLTVRVKAEVRGVELEDIELPDFQGFQIVSRRMSRPFSFRFGFGRGGGQVVQSRTEHILQLRALEPGTHRIEPAQATAGGKTYTSQPLTIRVAGSAGDALDPDGPDGTPGSAPPEAGQPEVDGARFDAQAFLRTVVDRQTPYVGEQVTVSIYLYVRNRLRSAPKIPREPSTDDFWTHDLLPRSRQLEPTHQRVRGATFWVYELRRFAAFPLRAGDLRIGAMEVELQSGSILDLLRQNEPIERQGVPVTLDVRPLPPPQPDDAVVGRYHLETELESDTVATGDAATLRVTVEGTGNLREVQLELPDIPNLRDLSPSLEDDVRAPNDIVGGTRTFEWLLVPEQEGTYEIPSFGFTAFDPEAEEYQEVRSEPLTLEAAGRAPTTDAEGTSDSGAAKPAPDGPMPFGPVRAKGELERSAPALSSRPWYPAALAAPPFAWLALLAAGRVRRRLHQRDRANIGARALKRRLREARAHAEANEPRAFYGAIAQALTRALANRIDEPVGSLTHGELRALLSERSMEAELVDRVMDELEGCDYARFSATGVTREEMDRCLGRVQALLTRIDKLQPRASEEGP